MSPLKRASFTVIAVVVIPMLFLLILEGGLRLVGVGTHYQYFNSLEIDGKAYFQDNKAFANQFYPPSLGVAPLNNTLMAERDENHIRVYILGGSAAQGFPHVNHGLDRHLSAHLQAAMPDKKIEIINTAMTSVNSHVVYEVARTLPANSADYAIVLMGNNEVVGPYGPSTFNQNFLSSLTAIRTLQFLKRTRLWQAIATLAQQIQNDSKGEDLAWQGMQMFSDFSVPYDDPRLEDVYRHYERNLNDIVDILRDKGMHVILSTVPVNLRHSAPFGSSHSRSLSESELSQWERLNTQASAAFERQDWTTAKVAYEALVELDYAYADSHFKLATVLENLSEHAAAKTHFEQALHYDTKRFRTTNVINDMIKNTAKEHAGSGALFSFVDNAAVFEQASAPFAPGLDLLHEHVHFDYDGNYYLAREFTRAIHADIDSSSDYKRLAKHQAAAMIGFPNHETNQVMQRLLNMVQKAPFTFQSNHAELVTHTEVRKTELAQQVGTPSDVIERRALIVGQGLADWKIHYELAELHRFMRNAEKSYHHLKEVVRLYPHNHESYLKLAELSAARGATTEAVDYLKQSLHYTRNDDAKAVQGFGMLGLNYMKMNNYREGKRYLLKVIEGYPDQISANLRAYGTLIKYARDNNLNGEVNDFVVDVKRYANGLIRQGQDEEFPLLYRRMAQIMAIAGESEEARRWQTMSSSD